MKRVCVFCGSSLGRRIEYSTAARELGGILAERGITLVYGGGNIGLMGEIADAVLAGGGQAIGVIPAALAGRELAHQGIQDLRVVDTMHQRKAMMADNADAFLAMPGGLGTLEELFEVLTWAQLGIHSKPCGLLNVEGYFDPLLAFLDAMVEARFVRPEHRQMILVDAKPEALLDRLAAYQPPQREKWIRRDER